LTPVPPHSQIPHNPAEDRFFLGSIPSILKNRADFHGWKLECHKKLGPTIVSFPLFNTSEAMISITSPENVEHILKTRVDNYIKSPKTARVLQELLGKGIFAISHGPHAEDGGASWVMQRKVAARIFTAVRARVVVGGGVGRADAPPASSRCRSATSSRP